MKAGPAIQLPLLLFLCVSFFFLKSSGYPAFHITTEVCEFDCHSFSGWDRSEEAVHTGTYFIGHPEGDVMKIAFDNGTSSVFTPKTQSADLHSAVNRIAWANCINAGQECIALDYFFVHESKKSELIQLMNKNIRSMY